MSHKTAPVEMRECFSLNDDNVPGFLERASSRGVDEVVYVATCNRVEIYFASADIQKSMQIIMDELEKVSSLRCSEFDSVIYRKYSRDAVLHMLTVASSLDSMVVGGKRDYRTDEKGIREVGPEKKDRHCAEPPFPPGIQNRKAGQG